MTILSFWVCDSHLYAATYQNGFHRTFDNTLVPPNTQATSLVPFLKSCLGSEPAPITTIIAPRGPGSFTSLRVTLATAQGLSIANPKATCFAPSHFDVMAFHAKGTLPENTPFLLLIDSKRHDYFGQLWSPLPHTPQNYDDNNIAELAQTIPNLHVIFAHEMAPYYATAQIQLFQSIKPKPEQSDFLPYYLHTPIYAKKHKPT